MTIYRVDEHSFTHTCPGNPEDHPYDTLRALVAITPGPPCLTPVTVRCNGTAVSLPCSRRLPHHKQCKNCAPILTFNQITADYIGHDDPTTATIPGGYADHPCTHCGDPLAAVLAPYRRHLLCTADRRLPAAMKKAG